MNNTVAVILAGGRSSRMGGTPKCLKKLNGQRILDITLQRLSSQVDHILISTTAHSTLHNQIHKLDQASDKKITCVDDAYPVFSGPLSGISSCMGYIKNANATTQWLLSLASDTPFIPLDLYERLHEAAVEHQADVVMAQCAGMNHYTCALWNLSCYETMNKLLNNQTYYRMQDIIRGLNHTSVDFPADNKHAFFNINTPQDLITAQNFFDVLATNATTL